MNGPRKTIDTGTGPEIIFEICNTIGWVRLNRPDKLNALNGALQDALVDVLRIAASREDLSCIILTGEGRGFCSGGDLRARQAEVERRAAEGLPFETPEEIDARLRRRMEASRLLHECDKVTIAMINGPCAGAGLALAAACDIRFMAASATLKPAFVNVGLPGDFGATWLWPDTFGAAEARRLFLFDESIEAAEALARGLVTKVFVDAELAEATQAEAERLARRPRSGVIAAKAALRRRGTTLGEAMDEEAIATGKAGRALRAAGQSPAHLFQRCN